ncbi:hypothetical protein H8N00_02645 [Streptomyces sp. AC563]|uniref:hypothetical protein n=1 Tax=Streptomyces buecherae TaxID=2763006 RepID=UPI00164E4F4A|nr:hypothetical protein [Streptomyces buecherae]MBC3987823.1 hypothetical protein [Streptomyces buecherae]
MNDRDLFGVTISAREIYDQIIGMREDLRAVRQQGEAVHETLEDHESRLRDMERWRLALPVAMLPGIVAAVVTVIQLTGKA